MTPEQLNAIMDAVEMTCNITPSDASRRVDRHDVNMAFGFDTDAAGRAVPRSGPADWQAVVHPQRPHGFAVRDATTGNYWKGSNGRTQFFSKSETATAYANGLNHA